MCDLEYNFKTMSKKDMVKRLEDVVDEVRSLKMDNQALEAKLDLQTRYKDLARAERNAAEKKLNELAAENKELKAENKELKELNMEADNRCMDAILCKWNLEKRLKEAEEAAKKASAALNRLTDSTQHLRCYLVNRHMYMQNPGINIPDDFMLEDAKYHFPFLNNMRIMVQSTCRYRQIKIICMYGGSYYYDFDTQTLKATETGD